jgi:DNA polymerase III gamma/tau subunit
VSAPRFEGRFDVVGAAHALAYFGTLDESRLSHGYLFAGPTGVGKKTFARRLAQSLLCDHPKSVLLGYDGTCPGCTSFNAGSHPDYYESIGAIRIGRSDGESVRDGEDMYSRGLIRELSLRPYVGRWRIALLGDVEFASPDAANALLKFLEEPPPGVLVVLTSSTSRALLPTIRSRLIEIAFGALTLDEVAGVLEREGVAPPDARAAAAASLGSVTRARSILDGAENELREASVAWFVDAMHGRIPEQSFLRLDDRGTSSAEKRELVAEMLDIIRMAARDWAALILAGPSAPLLASDVRKTVTAVPKRPPREVVGVLGAIAETQKLAETNVSAGLVVDYLRMQLAPATPL